MNEHPARRQAREAFDGNLAFAFTPRTSLIDAGSSVGPLSASARLPFSGFKFRESVSLTSKDIGEGTVLWYA